MKKSLIALAVAGVVAAPAAMAEVTIYGQANVSFDVTDNSATTANKVQSNASRIGFMGSEDLGGGTSAVWQIESAANLDGSGAAGVASRGSFAGLSGESWGTLKLGGGGGLDSPAKNAISGMDIFGDTVAGAGGGLLAYTGGTDAVIYTSPSMGGFKIEAAVVAGAELAATSAQQKGSAYSIGLSYAPGALYLGLGYDNMKAGSAGTGSAGVPTLPTAGDTASITTLVAGYTMDALWGGLTYQRSTYNPTGGTSASVNSYMVSGKYSFGSDAVKLQYTKAGNPTGASNAGASQVAVGYDHGMSKNTTLYALYTKITNDSGAAYNGGVSNAIAAGADPSAWSLGMKHSF